MINLRDKWLEKDITMIKIASIFLFLLSLLFLLCQQDILAEDGVTIGHQEEQTAGSDELRNKVQNPVSSMYSLPLKFSADFGAPQRECLYFSG